MKFPFEPRSTAALRQGQYWTFELSNGRLAVGVVIALATTRGKLNSRMFLAGLLDWAGNGPPSHMDLNSAKIIRSGFAHVATIQNHGGRLIGELTRSWDMPAQVEYRGLTTEGPSIWGASFIRALAEEEFGDSGWSDRQLEKIRGD
jgi:hypothetical protein